MLPAASFRKAFSSLRLCLGTVLRGYTYHHGASDTRVLQSWRFVSILGEYSLLSFLGCLFECRYASFDIFNLDCLRRVAEIVARGHRVSPVICPQNQPASRVWRSKP